MYSNRFLKVILTALAALLVLMPITHVRARESKSATRETIEVGANNGSSSQAGMTLSQQIALARYLRRQQPVVRKMLKGADDLDAGAEQLDADDLESAAVSFDSAANHFAIASGTLGQLTPPKPARRYHGLLKEALDDCKLGASKIAEGIRNNDPTMMEEGASLLLKGSEKMKSAKRALGRLQRQI